MILLLPTLATAQKPTVRTPDIVGTWRAAPSKASQPNDKRIRMTFKKDGSFTFHGVNTVGQGTYKVQNADVVIVLTTRNGSKQMADSERKAICKIVEGGKAILFPTGQKNDGVVQMLRLVRAR